MFVRLCQPFLVSGIGLAFYLVIESPLYITLFFLGVMVAISFANRRRLAKLAARRLMAVTPLPPSSSLSDGDDLLDEQAGEEEASISYSISSESIASALGLSYGDDGLDEDGRDLSSIVFSEERSDIHHAAPPLDYDKDCDNDSSSSIYNSPVEDDDGDSDKDRDWDQQHSSEDVYEIYGEGELDPELFLELQ
jgi:hypothetical protein